MFQLELYVPVNFPLCFFVWSFVCLSLSVISPVSIYCQTHFAKTSEVGSKSYNAHVINKQGRMLILKEDESPAFIKFIFSRCLFLATKPVSCLPAVPVITYLLI